MKILRFLAVFLFILLLNTSPALAQTNPIPRPSNPEHIEAYDTTVQVGKDAKLTVTEKIAYDFGDTNDKHGIFRKIPVSYQGEFGSAYRIYPNLISVVDDKGKKYTSKTDYSDGKWNIKIGDANQVVSGIKTYVISYTINGAVSFSPRDNRDHDEVYWNAVGVEWTVPVKNATARIILPETISNDLQVKCYVGKLGSKEECSNSVSEDRTTISFDSSRGLLPHEALTVVAGLPKGIIQEPSFGQKSILFAKANWPLTLPIITLIIMYFIWRKYGREPKGRGTIVAEYEPPAGLSPIEVGTIIDQKVHNHDISSIMIDLAIRDYLKIVEVVPEKWLQERDYRLVKLGADQRKLRDFEKTFFTELFKNDTEVLLSSLKTTFHKTAEECEKQVYEHLTEQKYFTANPKQRQALCIFIGAAIAIVGFFLIFLITDRQFWNGVSPIVAGGIVILFGSIMPSFTMLGKEAQEKIKGFKLFLSVTEKDRLKFHNAPEKKPELFEKFLPYAMVLKIEKDWARQFEGIYLKPPSWYEGDFKTFQVLAFVSHLDSFSSVATTSLTSSPSSSSGVSGGSSGGGFGGGGGGSW